MIFLKTAIRRRPRTRGVSGISTASGTSAYNLRKVQTIIANSVEDEILQLVDYPKQVLTKGRHLCWRDELRRNRWKVWLACQCVGQVGSNRFVSPLLEEPGGAHQRSR